MLCSQLRGGERSLQVMGVLRKESSHLMKGVCWEPEDKAIMGDLWRASCSVGGPAGLGAEGRCVESCV